MRNEVIEALLRPLDPISSEEAEGSILAAQQEVRDQLQHVKDAQSDLLCAFDRLLYLEDLYRRLTRQEAADASASADRG